MNSLRYAAARLFPFFGFFLFVESAARFALALYDRATLASAGTDLSQAFAVGMYFDVMVFFYLALPVLLLAIIIPRRYQGTDLDRGVTSAVFFVFAYSVAFSAVGEWFFWDEFQTRYNFIAVDYLVYTTEVIGNIRESYPVVPILAALAIAVAAVTWGVRKLWFGNLPEATRLPVRLGAMGALVLFTALSFAVTQKEQAVVSENRYVNEIARNGIFELFSAFRHNELAYKDFYKTLPEDEVRAFIAAKTGGDAGAATPLIHPVRNGDGKGKKHNLVVITVESLSAEYLEFFGGEYEVTPHLDALIPQSLFFTNLYATGTRTVYGLSALTLSMPPIPGNSIVRRPENGGLASIGQVLRDQGYLTKFIYGGYGYFDNMNNFFAANGYEIVDRSNLSKEEIGFANIWGVSDEDLFRRTLKENDEAHAAGRPFFDMLMTTSNHRPYTYPEGRIDLPPKSGRRGGVKYTDYAIDYFLKEAAKKPWFKDTIFVIVADHTAGSSGKSELDPDKYHIPMWVYAPGIIKPGKIDTMASQIDVVPTLLGLMGVNYESRFYGRDVRKEQPGRVFISNYQQLGYMTDKGLVILKPPQQADYFIKDAQSEFIRQDDVPPELLNEAIGYYQSAAQWQTWSKLP